jgi:hypothetical protein
MYVDRSISIGINLIGYIVLLVLLLPIEAQYPLPGMVQKQTISNPTLWMKVY